MTPGRPGLGAPQVLAKEKRSELQSGAVLTLCLAVHAVGIASDVPDGLQGHGLVLARQARLRESETGMSGKQGPKKTPSDTTASCMNSKPQTKVE